MAKVAKGVKVAKMSDEEKKLWQFWQNVLYFKNQRQMNNQQLCKVLKISEGTLRNRLLDPSTTCAKDQIKAAEYFGVPLERWFLPLVGAEVAPMVLEGADG